MFCMKCGKPIEDDQMLCPDCAAAAQPVQEQPVEIPAEEPIFQAPAEEPIFQVPVEQAPAEEATVPFTPESAENLFNLNFSTEPEQKEKKPRNPKNKKLIAWITSGVAALAIVAVGLLGFLVWDWGDWVQNLFWSMKSPEEYKNKIEQKALTDEDSNSEIASLRNGLVGMYGFLVNSINQEDSSAEMTVKVELSDEAKALLGSYLSMPYGMEIPSNASLTLNSSGDRDISQADLGLSLNDVQIMQLRYIVDILNEEGYLGVLSPEGMADEYLAMVLPEMYSAEYTALTVEFVESLPSEEEFAKMVDKYIMLAFEQITEVEKEKGTI